MAEIDDGLSKLPLFPSFSNVNNTNLSHLLNYLSELYPISLQLETESNHYRLQLQYNTNQLLHVKHNLFSIQKQLATVQEKNVFLEKYAASLVKERNYLLHEKPTAFATSGKKKKKKTLYNKENRSSNRLSSDEEESGDTDEDNSNNEVIKYRTESRKKKQQHFIWHHCCRKNDAFRDHEEIADLVPSIGTLRGETLQQNSKELEEMKKLVHKLKLEIETLKLDREELEGCHQREKESQSNYIAVITNKLAQQAILHGSLQKKFAVQEDQLGKHVEQHSQQMNELQSVVAEANKTFQESRQEISDLKKQVANLKREKETLNIENVSLKESKQLLSSQLENLDNELVSLKVEHDSLQTEVLILRKQTENEVAKQYRIQYEQLKKENEEYINQIDALKYNEQNGEGTNRCPTSGYIAARHSDSLNSQNAQNLSFRELLGPDQNDNSIFSSSWISNNDSSSFGNSNSPTSGWQNAFGEESTIKIFSQYSEVKSQSCLSIEDTFMGMNLASEGENADSKRTESLDEFDMEQELQELISAAVSRRKVEEEKAIRNKNTIERCNPTN